MNFIPPLYSVAAGVFTHPQCLALIAWGQEVGYAKVRSEFSKSDVCKNVSCRPRFADHPKFAPVRDRLVEIGSGLSQVIGINTNDHMEFVSLAKYDEGIGYGHHIDHDPTHRAYEDVDRKLSLVIPLTTCKESGIWLDSVGHVNLNAGDLIAFSGLLGHAAPEQKEGTRYTMAAWLGGPRWR